MEFCFRFANEKNKFEDVQETAYNLIPLLIDFELDDGLKRGIQEAEEEHKKSTNDIAMSLKSFNTFGKRCLLQHRFHPEAFLQLAIQLAYIRLHNSPASSYVTASTRMFYHGRTETCRATTTESVNLANAIIEGAKSKSELYQLMKQAISKFQSLMNEAMLGQGCDRHLLGLQILASELEPFKGKQLDIFNDKAFKKSGGGGSFLLSTSCAGYVQVCGYVPPMAWPEGYACFYGIENDNFTFTILAYNCCEATDCERFYEALERSLLDLQAILGEGAPVEVLEAVK